MPIGDKILNIVVLTKLLELKHKSKGFKLSSELIVSSETNIKRNDTIGLINKIISQMINAKLFIFIASSLFILNYLIN
jgi:hypothetical protein